MLSTSLTPLFSFPPRLPLLKRGQRAPGTCLRTEHEFGLHMNSGDALYVPNTQQTLNTPSLSSSLLSPPDPKDHPKDNVPKLSQDALLLGSIPWCYGRVSQDENVHQECTPGTLQAGRLTEDPFCLLQRWPLEPDAIPAKVKTKQSRWQTRGPHSGPGEVLQCPECQWNEGMGAGLSPVHSSPES